MEWHWDEFFDAFKDLGRDLRDLGEYATKGFVEEVVKGNEHYTTSYEKQDEADSIFASENSRQRKATESLNNAIKSFNDKVDLVNSRKKTLLKDLGQFTDTQKINAKASAYYIVERSYKEEHPFDDLSDRIGGIIAMEHRIKESDRYLEEAKEYRSESRARVAEMDNYKARIEALELTLDEENKVLDILEKSMGIKRSLEYQAIAEQLHNLLAKSLSGADGQINNDYALAVRRLSELCGSI